MTDAQLRRRYKTVMAVLAVPAVDGLQDDLDLHLSAIEVEAARRGLDLHEPTPPPPGPTQADILVAAGIVVVFIALFAWALSWTPS